MEDDFPYDADRNIHRVGPCIATWRPQQASFSVAMVDGGPVPSPVAGGWTDLEALRAAVKKLWPEEPEPATEQNVRTSKLGEHPNSPTAFEEWQQERRSKVQHVVGPYLLSLDPHWRLYTPSRPDGKPIPKGLVGRWNSVAEFRAKAIALDPIGSKAAKSSTPYEPTPAVEETEIAQPKGNGLEEYLERRSVSGKRGAK